MREIKKILEALEKGDEKLLLSDVSCSFTIGELKDLIINSMTKMYEILEDNDYSGNHKLEDWQINDVKRHYFKDWLKNYN